ncbi:MAG: hypothetical protein UIH27_14230 [Ruminococcus sp.]|nr:hypothetical protein [Ruminococcus sp.]
MEVNRGFLSGRFLGYSLREFGLRRPLEMTYIGNGISIALTASDISILARANADVTYIPNVKYASQKTWRNLLGGEPWLPVRGISRLFADANSPDGDRSK